MTLEIVYNIEKEASELGGNLFVKLVQAKRNGLGWDFIPHPPITQSRWQQLAGIKDKEAFRVSTLQGTKLESGCLKIPYSQSIQALKYLAATCKLFFQYKQLACDFFTKVEIYYLVNKCQVQGMLKFLDQEFELTSCNFVSSNGSPWFIKGNLLRFIATHIPAKHLRQLYTDPSQFSLDNLQNAESDFELPLIVYKDNSLEQFKQMQQPYPLLLLKDRSGAFADLWMDYGKRRLYSFSDRSSMDKHRDFLAEKNWEKDLLETDFLRKQVGDSYYYCPLNAVAKSLTFLLEIGWNIQDYQKRKIFLMSDAQLELSMQAQTILIKGSFKYKSYEADLKEVAGAFNRRERFVQMGGNAIGLLPEKWNKVDLNELFEAGEIVAEGIQLKKHFTGVLENILQQPNNLKLDEALLHLKSEMASLSEIPTASPSTQFLGQLRPYQQLGVNWLNFLQHYSFNGMLCDDMGLGKTVQVLAFLSRLNNPKPVLIVMPMSLIFNWRKEIERFLPEKSVVLHHGPLRKTSFDNLQHGTIILTSYTIMRIDLSLFSSVEFAAVILDEAQMIKNSQTQAAQAAYQIKANFRLLLTGTPIENHLGEIWSHFHFLMPELLGDEKNFNADIQASQSDMRYLQKIKKKIRPFILRRKKDEVAKDLPECIEQIIWVEMTPDQRKIYEGFLSGIKSHLFTKVKTEGLSKHRMEVFEAILRLRQICCHPFLISSQLSNNLTYDSGKMEVLLQDLENAIDENGKVLIYSQFTSMLGIIAKEVQQRRWNYVYLDGSTKDREQMVTQFQEDPNTNLFLISLKAGGTGLNLTAADYVHIFDPWWNEAAEKQAINRAHRIGRKGTVFAKRYVTIESIEEKMMKLKAHKKMLIDQVLDDEIVNHQLTFEDFAYLLES